MSMTRAVATFVASRELIDGLFLSSRDEIAEAGAGFHQGRDLVIARNHPTKVAVHGPFLVVGTGPTYLARSLTRATEKNCLAIVL